MESRTRLAIGGMATVAASVTVICVVALTNSLALSESTGSPIDAAPVIVPASNTDASPGVAATPTPAPGATPVSTPAPPVVETPTAPSTSTPTAEVVPVPEAKVVTPTRPAPDGHTTKPTASDTQEKAIARAKAARSWEPLREWAERRGWSEERIDRFIAKLKRLFAEQSAGDRDWRDGDRDWRDGDRDWRHDDDSDSDGDRRGDSTGSSQDRPANADANANRWSERPGDGEKKARWRDSPEVRDR